MSKGSPGGIIGAHSPPWGDSRALAVPWGKRHQILSLPYVVASRKKKKRKNFTRLSFKGFSLVLPCLCFFVKCPSFLSPVFSCLSVTPSKTLFLEVWLFCCCHLAGRNNKNAAYYMYFIAKNYHHNASGKSGFCPVPCPCPPLSLTSFHLLLALSFAFSFPLISQQLSPQLASLRVFPPPAA